MQVGDLVVLTGPTWRKSCGLVVWATDGCVQVRWTDAPDYATYLSHEDVRVISTV